MKKKKDALVYHPKTGTFSEENYERQTFGSLKTAENASHQLEHLESIMEEISPDEIFEEEIETPLVKEFRAKKKEIMSELRDLVLKDPSMKQLMGKTNIKNTVKTKGLSQENRRKWALFLKYADVWDDDLKNLGYLELKKIYALTKLNN